MHGFPKRVRAARTRRLSHMAPVRPMPNSQPNILFRPFGECVPARKGRQLMEAAAPRLCGGDFVVRVSIKHAGRSAVGAPTGVRINSYAGAERAADRPARAAAVRRLDLWTCAAQPRSRCPPAACGYWLPSLSVWRSAVR